MRVFKFGGASVQSAEAVKNVSRILQEYGNKPLVIVISAMGKTTNALEAVLSDYWNGIDFRPRLQDVKKYHFDIMEGLFGSRSLPIWDEIDNLFLAIELYFEKPLERNYDFLYDQIVSYGEILSTKIVSAYLNETGYRNKWIDARHFIITDNLYREARVDWDTTQTLISRIITGMANEAAVITQGFIGSTKDNITTTLGREGSDFTASIFAFALTASELVIWKDVPGILNADPKRFPNTRKFDRLSYHEAVEMTYYGATVLHPKTIKPLQNKNIPLNVRSFVHPEKAGTLIREDFPVNEDTPIIILKENQVLLSLSTKDYSFMAEENIETVFDEVVRNGIKVNVMNNSAISFLMCIDDRGQKVQNFIESLEKEFIIERTDGLELLTIKHYHDQALGDLLNDKKIMMELRSGTTVQFVLDLF